MSNYSSEEELGDSLQIKPPQLKPSHRSDRMHRRDRHPGDSHHSNSGRPSSAYRRHEELGGYEGTRRRDFEYEHASSRRGEGSKYSSSRRYYNASEEGERNRRERARSKYGVEKRQVPEPSADQGLPSSSYRPPSPLLRDPHAHQLQKHKKKRRHAEEEEERVFREIEKRRERERHREEMGTGREEGSGSSGTHKRSKKSRREPAESPSPPARALARSPDHHHTDSNDGEMLDITVSDEEGRNLLPRLERSRSPSENSDSGDDQSGSRGGEHNQGRISNAASDISSESETKQSKSDSSSKSGSDDSESDSSDSSSGREEAAASNKNGKESNGRMKSKTGRSKGSPKSNSEGEEVHEVPSEDEEESIPLAKDSLASSPPPSAIEPEKVEKVERELTEVEKACQELDLLPPYYPAIQGCRRVEEFQLVNRIEEGTYGVVYRAKDKRTNEFVALKRLKMEKEKDGFPITSLREINTLLKSQHENIVTVREIVVGSNTDKIFLVMDYVEHDLKSLMETLKQKKQEFIMGEVKCLLIQLLRAVAHLHDNWILHRDLKTSNLLLSHKGILKVGDFGLAREYGSPLKPYTPIVVTLWYRAPELLLGAKEYSTPIDVWSVGCIFGELLKMEPMFPGKSEANQLNLIFQTLGTPNDRIWPGYSKLPLLQKMTFAENPMNKLKTRFGILSETGIDLMNKFLTYNPAKRITAEAALEHSFFREAPLPIDPSIFPTWPAKSEMGIRKHASPKPPSGGRQYKDLKEDDSVGFFLGVGEGRRPPVGAGFSLKF